MRWRRIVNVHETIEIRSLVFRGPNNQLKLAMALDSLSIMFFIIPGRKYINNPIKRRPSWILAARSKTARDTAWQTAKVDSAKNTLEKRIRQL